MGKPWVTPALLLLTGGNGGFGAWRIIPEVGAAKLCICRRRPEPEGWGQVVCPAGEKRVLCLPAPGTGRTEGEAPCGTLAVPH